jgi:hypothetical protein
MSSLYLVCLALLFKRTITFNFRQPIQNNLFQKNPNSLIRTTECNLLLQQQESFENDDSDGIESIMSLWLQFLIL